MAKKFEPLPDKIEISESDAIQLVDALDAAEPAVEPLEVAASAIRSYTLVEGDSWASVAAKHPLAGKTKHERAVELAAKHGEAVAGKVVEL